MQKIFLGLKNLDKDTYKIMKYGLMFSAFVTLISTLILFTYIFINTVFLYHLGLSLLKLSFSFATQFIICGIIVDSIRKNGI